MGGILILGAIIFSCLCWGDLQSKFLWILLFIISTFGAIGFLDDYLKLKDKKKLFCEFYEWIGSSSEGKLQGYIQQWYRNGNKRFEGNYVDGKKHGGFVIYKENGAEEFYGNFENGELLETNYGF